MKSPLLRALRRVFVPTTLTLPGGRIPNSLAKTLETGKCSGRHGGRQAVVRAEAFGDAHHLLVPIHDLQAVAVIVGDDEMEAVGAEIECRVGQAGVADPSNLRDHRHGRILSAAERMTHDDLATPIPTAGPKGGPCAGPGPDSRIDPSVPEKEPTTRVEAGGCAVHKASRPRCAYPGGRPGAVTAVPTGPEIATALSMATENCTLSGSTRGLQPPESKPPASGDTMSCNRRRGVSFLGRAPRTGLPTLRPPLLRYLGDRRRGRSVDNPLGTVAHPDEST